MFWYLQAKIDPKEAEITIQLPQGYKMAVREKIKSCIIFPIHRFPISFNLQWNTRLSIQEFIFGALMELYATDLILSFGFCFYIPL